MRTLEQLLEKKDPAWPIVQKWIAEAKNEVIVLPTTPERGAETLVGLQVTTRSPMGAIAYHSGGLLVDRGWVRVLGAGGPRMEGNFARWNGGSDAYLPRIDGAMVVANDVLGGLFALDGGAFGPARGGAFYFAPDSLQWEDLERGYSDLLKFFLDGDLAKFYGNQRWSAWENDVAALDPDRGMSLFPPQWSKEGADPSKVSRAPVPMKELVRLQLDVAAQVRK
jgi:hypothetical protein